MYPNIDAKFTTKYFLPTCGIWLRILEEQVENTMAYYMLGLLGETKNMVVKIHQTIDEKFIVATIKNHRRKIHQTINKNSSNHRRKIHQTIDKKFHVSRTK